eukprot:Skav219481  [mRNA]  locus=scaffold2719:183005:183811:+ [translate_table: standard]
MKTAFWLSEDPIGREIICPRDGRAGCALVDWIPRDERREQTHFMSWTWRYSLQQLDSREEEEEEEEEEDKDKDKDGDDSDDDDN